MYIDKDLTPFLPQYKPYAVTSGFVAATSLACIACGLCIIFGTDSTIPHLVGSAITSFGLATSFLSAGFAVQAVRKFKLRRKYEKVSDSSEAVKYFWVEVEKKFIRSMALAREQEAKCSDNDKAMSSTAMDIGDDVNKYISLLNFLINIDGKKKLNLKLFEKLGNFLGQECKREGICQEE